MSYPRLALPILLVWAIAAQAQAQPGPVAPQKAGLVVPTTVTGPAGSAIHVKASSPAIVFKWLPSSDALDVFHPAAGVDPAQCAVRSTVPGTYRLWCVACLGDVMAAKAITVVVTGPDPPVPPAPVNVGKLFIVVIETPAGAANRGLLFTDAGLETWNKVKRNQFRIVDSAVVGPDGKPPGDVKPYLDLAKGKMLPQVFLVTEQGVLIYSGDLPATADGLLALLRKVGN